MYTQGGHTRPPTPLGRLLYSSVKLPNFETKRANGVDPSIQLLVSEYLRHISGGFSGGVSENMETWILTMAFPTVALYPNHRRIFGEETVWLQVYQPAQSPSGDSLQVASSVLDCTER